MEPTWNRPVRQSFATAMLRVGFAAYNIIFHCYRYSLGNAYCSCVQELRGRCLCTPFMRMSFLFSSLTCAGPCNAHHVHALFIPCALLHMLPFSALSTHIIYVAGQYSTDSATACTVCDSGACGSVACPRSWANAAALQHACALAPSWTPASVRSRSPCVKWSTPFLSLLWPRDCLVHIVRPCQCTPPRLDVHVAPLLLQTLYLRESTWSEGKFSGMEATGCTSCPEGTECPLQ